MQIAARGCFFNGYSTRNPISAETRRPSYLGHRLRYASAGLMTESRLMHGWSAGVRQNHGTARPCPRAGHADPRAALHRAVGRLFAGVGPVVCVRHVAVLHSCLSVRFILP